MKDNILAASACKSTDEANIIISNYYSYYRAFALSGVVDFRGGLVNLIIPKPNENGPSLAFNIKLNEENAGREIQSLIKGIREKTVPQNWFVTPDSTPRNIISVLEENGFSGFSENASEPAMLLYKKDFLPYRSENDSVVCRKVCSKEDFKAWVDVVNTALHGWDMIDPENYFIWVGEKRFNFYLGEINGVPASTAATIQNGDTGSLEFVSTLSEFRHRGAAATVSTRAIEELFNGVETVTLSGGEEAVPLYKKLGFHSVFNNIIMRYSV